MHRSNILLAVALVATPLCAQRHSGSPPTAPPRPAPPPVAVSSGLGAIQFTEVSYGVPAPQSLTRQLRIDDDRTRAAALSAIGAPGQYLQRGHVGMPHSVQLEFAQLGTDEDLDAILTVELDQHIVTAILIPDGDNWRRIATLFVANPFNDPETIPSTFVLTERSVFEQNRYRAVFHADTADAKGNYSENEAQLRIVNKRPVITISFVSASRDCTPPPVPPTGKPSAANGCNILRRWLQPDLSGPAPKRFLLVTATGHLSTKETASPLDGTIDYEAAHLRSFSCQPFYYADSTQHFEPTGPSTSCPLK